MNDVKSTTDARTSNCQHEALEDVVKTYWDNYPEGNSEAECEQRRQMPDDWELKCPTCGKQRADIQNDPNDLDPTSRTSQQPHGDCTMYCNMCQMYVKPTTWDGEQVCPYHQRTMQTEEGPALMYDEFNQDGEEW